jgi:hypothetical protein
MKIGYDGAGKITAVVIDSQQLSAPNILAVADNADYLAHPGKYQVVAGAMALRRYLVMSTSTPSVAHGASAAVTITAYLANGTPDTAGVDVVRIMNRLSEDVTGYTSPITLVAGVATFNVSSSTAQDVVLVANSDTAWASNALTIQYT